ncbi:MAG TPA: transcriptional repressor, partial [Anaerolineae bacterium]|nr:transcriptional repressor [Anaerolineae bacterium]
MNELHDRGFRITPQREMVLASLHHIDGHATVDEIYARVQARSSSVDVSTVYRTLELLKEFRLVAYIDLGDGQHRYEL